MLGEDSSLLGSCLIPPLDLLLRLESGVGVKRDAARVYKNGIKRATGVLNSNDDSDTLGIFSRVVVDANHHATGIGLDGGGGKEARGGDVHGLADVALHPVSSGGDRNTLRRDIAGPVESINRLPLDVNKGGEGLGAPDRVEDH